MRKTLLSRLDKKQAGLTNKIARDAGQQKMPIYLVGGVVRDLLLRREIKDLDFVVQGDAIKLARKVAERLKGTLVVHKRFRTATVVLQNNSHIDFATARKESYPSSGALPVVETSSLLDDLRRRDFTINAMALSVSNQNAGTLIDPFGGVGDLDEGIIRILHQESFKEDPTRVLRAVRFEQRFQFSLSTTTKRLLQKTLKNKYEKNVKRPRYFSEFRKILREPHAMDCLKRLDQLRGLEFLGLKGKLDVRSFNQVQENISRGTIDPMLVPEQEKFLLLMILERCSEKGIGKISQAWPLSRDEKKAISQILRIKQTLRTLTKPSIMRSVVYTKLVEYDKVVLQLMICLTRSRRVKCRLIEFLKNKKDISLLITGQDFKELGLVQGRAIGKLLEEVLLSKIDGKIKTKRQELALAKRLCAR